MAEHKKDDESKGNLTLNPFATPEEKPEESKTDDKPMTAKQTAAAEKKAKAEDKAECNQCGAKHDADAHSCPKCGIIINEVAP